MFAVLRVEVAARLSVTFQNMWMIRPQRLINGNVTTERSCQRGEKVEFTRHSPANDS
jgi:hypothetical protein